MAAQYCLLTNKIRPCWFNLGKILVFKNTTNHRNAVQPHSKDVITHNLRIASFQVNLPEELVLLGESLRWTIQQSVAMKNSNATTELSECYFYTWYIYWITLFSSSEPNIHDCLSVSLYNSYFWLPLYIEPLGQFHKHDAKYPYGVLFEHFEKVLFFKGGGGNHETLKISNSEIIFC